MVKDFYWNIIPWNALLCLENIKIISILDIEIYEFDLNTCYDLAKRAETRVGFPVIFSRLRWPIDPKFSQFFLNFIYKLWYTKCGLGKYCLLKVFNGFKITDALIYIMYWTLNC